MREATVTVKYYDVCKYVTYNTIIILIHNIC